MVRSKTDRQVQNLLFASGCGFLALEAPALAIGRFQGIGAGVAFVFVYVAALFEFVRTQRGESRS